MFFGKESTAILRGMLVAAFLGAQLVSFGTAYAEIESEDLPDREGVEAGPLTVHVAMKSGVQADTNVFLEDEDEKFDFITLVNPSAGLSMKLGDHNVSAEYDAAINFFGKHTQQNYADHRVQGLLELNITDYEITVENLYRRFSSRAGSEDTNRIARQVEKIRTGIAAEFEQLEFDAGYTFMIDDFISKETIFRNMTYQDKDRIVNQFELEGGYRFLPKTSALVETTLGFINYASGLSSDSFYIEPVFGLRGDLRDDFSIDLMAGFRYQKYDEGQVTSGNDFFGFVARGGIEYQMNDDDTVKIKVERAIYESVYNDMNYYNVNHIGFDFIHEFNRKLTGTVSAAYQMNLYPSETTEDAITAKRYDHFYMAGGLLRYDITKWLSMEARYDFSLRDSRFDTFDYIDHMFTVQGTVGF